MTRVRILVSLVFLLGVLFASTPATAQVDQVFETGMNPYRSYQGGAIDHVAIWSRQLNVDIPIISYPQRGGKLQLSFVLHYANLGSYYNEDCSTSPCSFTTSGLEPRSGFSVIQAGTVNSAYSACGSNPNNQLETCSYTVNLADGSTSSLGPTDNTTWKSPDLQGFQYITNSQLSDRNGTTWGAPDSLYANLLPLWSWAIGGTYPPGLITDVNGNQISFGSTGWNDTIGRKIPLPVSTAVSQCPQTPLVPDAAYIWNFKGINGGNYPVLFCYVEVPYYEPNPPNPPATGNMEQLQSVVLPNNTAWTFQYTTDGNADLSSIAFPTGGKLTYTWLPTGNYPDDCAIHTVTNSRLIASRTLTANNSDSPSSTWNYSSVSGSQVVTDPLANDTVHTFTSLNGGVCPVYETTTKFYQGSQTSGTLLKTVSTVFKPLGTNINYPNYYFGQPGTITSVWANGTTNQTQFSYDSAVIFQLPYFYIAGGGLGGLNNTSPSSYGLPQMKFEYDYGTGGIPGSLVRTTTTAYQALTDSNYLKNNLLTLPASVAVSGSGPGSKTAYYYDQTGVVGSGATQLNTAPPAGTHRGNLTTVAHYLNTTSAYLNTTTTYYDTGLPQTVTDPKLNTAETYGYSSAYNYGLVTSATNALGQTTTYGYDLDSGLVTSVTDPNGQLSGQNTSVTYDSMLRPASVSYPDGGHTTFSHQETSFPFTETTTTKITSALNSITTASFDGVGRRFQSELVTDVPTPTFNVTHYDAMGRIAVVYNATRCNPPTTNCGTEPTWGTTSFSYDALGRTTLVTEPDLSTKQTSYAGKVTTAIDETGNTQQLVADGLNRLAQVIDDPAGLNYQTTYAYDALDDRTSVNQGGSRLRSYGYDSLGRLVSSSDPEAGAVSYSYDANNNPQTILDARSFTTTYQYDSINRLLSTSYSNGDPTVSFIYDNSSCQSAPACYNIGYRTSSADAAGAESWAYDQLGRLIAEHRHTNGVAKNFLLYYNLDGSVASETYPTGESIAYTYNGAGRQTSVIDAALSNNYATGVTYAPAGSLSSATFGAAGSFAGINLNATYNNRLQPNEIKYWSTSGTALDLSDNFVNSHGHNNGQVATITNNLHTGRSQNFTYDTLNRVATAQTTATSSTSLTDCWGEKYTVDQWGNLSGISESSTAYNGCTQESISYVPTAKNQLTGFAYDASGNTTNDGSYPYTWNAESQLTSARGVTYLYDGDGNRVEKQGSKLYWRGVNNETLDESDASGNFTDEYVYLQGKRIAHRIVGGAVTYYASDALGTNRVVMTAAGATCFDADFYTFGVQRTPYVQTCVQNYKFTGAERDSESNFDYLGARYNKSNQGRFLSPDPQNAGADAKKPQSWNMYVYVLDNPVNNADPFGLDCIYLNEDATKVNEVLTGENQDCRTNADGSPDDGYYVDGTVDRSSVLIDSDTNFITFWKTTDTDPLPILDGKCLDTCADSTVHVIGIPDPNPQTIGYADPLGNPFEIHTAPINLPPILKAPFYMGCFNNEVIQPEETSPKGSTDVPAGHQGGARDARSSDGRRRDYNPKGQESQTPDVIIGVAGAINSTLGCVAATK
jgi:RHS repeat-associated protein